MRLNFHSGSWVKELQGALLVGFEIGMRNLKLI